MNCKLFRVPTTFVGKDKKEVRTNDYFIEFENGEYIQIVPKWTKNSNDYIRLRAFSDLKDHQ